MMSASGWSEAEGADAVGAVAVLEAAQQLALGEQRHRHEVEDHDEDHQRLEHLHPPGLVVADLGEDGARRGLAGGTATRRTSTIGSVSALRAPRAVPSTRKTVPSGTAARSRDRPAHAGAVRADLDVVAVADAEALGVGGRELDELVRAQELQRRRDLDLRRAQIERNVPSRSAPLPRRRHGRRHLELRELPRGRVERARRLGRRPAHAAPADLVERQAGVERDRLEQLPGRHRAGEHAGVVPGRARRGRR